MLGEMESPRTLRLPVHLLVKGDAQPLTFAAVESGRLELRMYNLKDGECVATYPLADALVDFRFITPSEGISREIPSADGLEAGPPPPDAADNDR